MFDAYLQLWQLSPEGAPIITRGSRLLPVRWQGKPAMLKIALEPEEKLGATILEWWNGDGAAHVFALNDEALLLERAEGTRSLIAMSQSRRDDEATVILCDAAARLHTNHSSPPTGLPILSDWFHELEKASTQHGGILQTCADTAHHLLATPQDILVLHGDIHHGNILDFGPRGWLAIDPKGILGERGFDYANIFCNPDLADPTQPIAVQRDRFIHRLEMISRAAGLDRRRLLQWILAWSGLSAAWFLSDGDTAETNFAIAKLALAELQRCGGE